MNLLLASCAPLPGQSLLECRDQIRPSLLKPLLLVILCSIVVGVTVWLARKDRPALEVRRGLAAAALAVLAVVLSVTASWATTHEYFGGCTPLGAPIGLSHGACLRNARLIAAGYAIGAGIVLWLLVIAARGPARRTS
jgi:hypothetical protein